MRRRARSETAGRDRRRHPTCISLPVSRALGEMRDASGRAAVQGGFHHVGDHATGIVSHSASALAAGTLLGLNEAQIVAALGSSTRLSTAPMSCWER